MTITEKKMSQLSDIVTQMKEQASNSHIKTS